MCELKGALSKLKNGKAEGSSNILPDMVKATCEEESFRDLLLDFVHTVWEERQSSSPSPRKGTSVYVITGEVLPCWKWSGR